MDFGIGQQTAAARMLFLKMMARGSARPGATRKRRKKKAATATRKRRKSAKSKRPARLVKGSAAAKKYMASIRRKRK